MKLIGLTGGIACGKSTVAAHLAELGADVIDADQVSRDVVAPGTSGLEAIVDRFGDDVLTADGTLDRKRLGRIVIQDDAARRDLEQITHPRIRDEVAQRIQERAMAGAVWVFVEAALLVETGSWKLYDGLWVVRCSRDVQVQRLMERDACEAKVAEQWIDSQMPVDEKVKHASQVIDNDGDRSTLEKAVAMAWKTLRGPQQDQD